MIFGVALAGGEARRMGGGDKPLLEIGGRSMLARVVDRLRGEAAEVAISANGDPLRLTAFRCPVLPDGDFAGRGPLAGVLAGLEWAAFRGADAVLTIPGDVPFAPSGLGVALAPAPAWAASGGQVHHLVALWPVSAAVPLRRVLEGPGPFAVHAFGRRIGMRTVCFPEADEGAFVNVNTPAELTAARRIRT